MATKTITIDVEAYERLSKAKRDAESFSEVIKRVVPKRVDYEAWLKAIQADPFSDKFVAAVEEQVQGRRKRSKRGR